MKATKSIGILREVKNKWERRVAITPSEVKKLVDRQIKVLIEPCERRVFKDIDYKKAGAIITNDLSPSSFIIGVKDIESHKLFENHSYLNFSHVIKGQPANMPFLDECFAKKIRLFDYECIKNPDTKVRTVAFGRFAGLSGMVTGMRGLGEHLLAKDSATPFLNISSTYMYTSLNDAQLQVAKIGEMITKYGLPQKYAPFVFTFTGKGGNVTNGALEMFKLLPHEFIDAKDLPKLRHNFDSHKVYGVVLSTQSIVSHRKNGDLFEEKHYFDYPEEYEPVFHSRIAPYTSVLVNGMYWDHRYPRLLSNKQMQELYSSNPGAMLALFDISCDVEGAFEFMSKTSNTDSPFFTYNPDLDDIVDEIDGDGVLILAVDSLPAELPKDSSEYFSKTLYPYLERLATSDCGTDTSMDQQEKYLGAEMFNAMITYNGDYTKNFQYIRALRRQHKMSMKIAPADNIKSTVLKIDGHLFDSGIINQILDMIEIHNCEYNILNLASKVNTRELQKASQLILQIDMHISHDTNERKMDELVTKLNTLCELHPKAEAKLVTLPFGATRKFEKKNKEKEKQSNVDPNDSDDDISVSAKTKQNKNYIANERNEDVKPAKNILLFGSGFVSKPVIDFLSLSGNNNITVASNDISAANTLCDGNKYCKTMLFDVLSGNIDALVSTHDIVISLLPASMHIPIAKSCVKYGKDMATASYISDEMKLQHQDAINANVILLNECGLDPGLDHMSAVKIINEVKDEGINGFASYCGGLPSPESANNLFGYKFSWSPMGVLRALRNDARYLTEGKLINICGDELLANKFALQYLDNPYPSLSFEHLANRDSLKYIDKYKLDKNELKSMYRGTLRYNGFSDMLYGCKVLGLLDDDNEENKENKGEIWCNYLYKVIINNIKNKNLTNKIFDFEGENSLKYLIEDVLIKNTDWKNDKINLFLQCLETDLHIFDSNTKLNNTHKSAMNAFCELLEHKLCFDEVEERDMVIMINRISTNENKMYESSLLVYGDDEYSAMSRTVGFPLAIATQFLLNGDIDKNYKENIGVIDATNITLSNMILNKCTDYGIKFKNRIITQNTTNKNKAKIIH